MTVLGFPHDDGPTLAEFNAWADRESVGPPVTMPRQVANMAEVALIRYLRADRKSAYDLSHEHGARYAISRAIEAADLGPTADVIERLPDAYVHLPCQTLIEWNERDVREHGPIGEQDCDCETPGEWRAVYLGPLAASAVPQVTSSARCRRCPGLVMVLPDLMPAHNARVPGFTDEAEVRRG